MSIKPKKYLGQHFLQDESVIDKTIQSIDFDSSDTFIEVGPGMGVLTDKLIPLAKNLKLVELDRDAVEYLTKNYPEESFTLYSEDFLKTDLATFQSTSLAIIGNFPYNISSQIIFKIWEQRELVNQMVGMFQKEVARRICSKSGSKEYGILSVLIQYDYQATYLFEIQPTSFFPPPKVVSAVMKLQRKDNVLPIDRTLFKKLVKVAFSQRRKKLRNVLKIFPLDTNNPIIDNFLNLRAEQLSVEDFITLYQHIEDGRDSNNPT